MSVAFITLAVLGFLVLTAGTAIFVAAEFSLTALERSTVDANARTGGRRDKLIQRGHRTLSFQLSGAQVGISLTTLITGYLAEPLFARALTILEKSLSPAHPALAAVRENYVNLLVQLGRRKEASALRAQVEAIRQQREPSLGWPL